MSKIWAIARHDFLATVRRKGYILTTLGMPVIFAVMGIMAAAPTYLMLYSRRPEGERIHVVDRTKMLLGRRNKELDELKRQYLEACRTQGGRAAQKAGFKIFAYSFEQPLRLYADEQEARKRLSEGVIDVYYLVGPDYVRTGAVAAYTREEVPSWVASLGVAMLRDALIDVLLAERSGEEVVERVKRPIALETLTVSPSGRVTPLNPLASLVHSSLPYAFGVLLMLCIFMTSGYMLQSLTEEKASRMLEVLLSCVTPRQLLIGKLLGLGGAGFGQFLLWLCLGITPLVAFTSLVIGVGTVVLMAVYFLLGFVLFGCLTFGVASIMNASKESQHLASAWSILAALPLLVSPLIVKAPGAVLARTLSLVPLTSPVTMILRVSTHRVGWLDVGLSVAVLAGSIAVLISLACDLLRLSMLMRGRFPGLREVFRALRA